MKKYTMFPLMGRSESGDKRKVHSTSAHIKQNKTNNNNKNHGVISYKYLNSTPGRSRTKGSNHSQGRRSQKIN
jgi:hypothetical protein